MRLRLVARLAAALSGALTAGVLARGPVVASTVVASTVMASTVVASPVVASTVTTRVAVAAPVKGEGAGGVPDVPLFAYYYIWFTPASWNRAKIDYPLIGRYASDDPAVMREQIQEARSAGIDGFIVSWKNTPADDRTLRLLMSVAGQEHFQLAMIYEGLDFSRHPLPVSDVAAGFRLFRDDYASSPVWLRVNGKPLTIWSGTWDYSHAAVASVTSAVRGSLLVLSTEKSVAGFRRLADVTDGDAYYWSSVNPQTDSGYAEKMDAMSNAIHQAGKYWIAPFAPGFDARLIGGRSVVPRNDGQTLRAEYATAAASSPDILGLISWNEFSENTYVEPSVSYGRFYLHLVGALRGAAAPAPRSAAGRNDSRPAAGSRSHGSGGLWLLGLAITVTGIVALAARRRVARRAARDAASLTARGSR
jgi:Glycosyl hydrolase family 71